MASLLRLLTTAMRSAVPAVIITAACSASAAAATSTWTAAGGTSNFSDAGNWDAFPTPDCIMVFPPGAAFASKGAPVNDLIGLTINQLNISETYVISGNAVVCKNINDNSAGIVTVSLPISTAGSAVLTVTVTIGGATLNLSGKLTGAGPVTYSGPGSKRLNGTVNNTLTGLSTVAQGHLVLASTASEAIAGPLLIDSGATANLMSAPEIKDDVVVTVNGTFDLSAATGSDGAATETIGGLRGTDISAITSLGANSLACTAQVAPTNYLGRFIGTGAFRQTASGVEVLSGASPGYSGTVDLAGGSIHIWGSLGGSPVNATSGTLLLANDATVGPVTLTGSSSTLSFDETISAMTMHGSTPSLTLGIGSHFLVTTRPSDFSAVSTAAASIDGAVLVVDTSSFTPTPTSVMTIITNTGSAPIAGTFANLAEGATVSSATNPGTTFIISYIGGSGNDVTLTGVAASSDTTAPAITGVTAGSITGNSVVVTWTTNEAATSQVEYGTDTAYGSQSALDATLATSHSVSVTGLAGSTLYHFRVHSRDAAGNLATSADATFTTAADTAAPVISAVTVGSITGTTALASWTTDEASDSQVQYGLTAAYGTSTALDTSMVTAHAVPITGLTVSTRYHFRVLSKDASGNLQASGDGTFTTTNGSAPSTSDDHRCGSGSVFGFLALGLLLSMRVVACLGLGGKRSRSA